MKWLFLLIPTLFVYSQSASTRWQDHFSYANIKHIWEINGLIFCSAENGIFSYDPASGEIIKISKTTELNDVGITAFNYNPENEIMFIGYQSGELDILTPDGNRNLLEIPLHQGYTGSKAVNHITTYQNTAIISGDFGIVSYSLEDFEFKETAYFIFGGNYYGVNESVVMNGIIYTAGNGGVYHHNLDEFIANFTSWERPQGIPNSPFQDIVAFGGSILANTWGNVYRFDGSNWTFFGNYPTLRDININGDVLTISQLNEAANYDLQFNLLETVTFTEDLNSAVKIGTTTYGATKEKGLAAGINHILPDGPFNNKSWSATAFDEQIWIAPGGMNDFEEPQTNEDGYFHSDGSKWSHIKSEDMLNAKDIVHIEVNPANPSEVYVSSWFEYVAWTDTSTHRGMFKMINNTMSEHYNSENSVLKSKERIAASKLDAQGNLWVCQSFLNQQGPSGVAKKSPSGEWSFIDIGGDADKAGVRPLIVYQDHAWVPLPRSGGIKVTDMENVYTISSTASQGSLPSGNVLSVAIDQDGVLWIGTLLGLRILYNPLEAVVSGSFETQPIIIEQNGIPEALLMDTQINDIEVDGANRKWIATDTSGAYYISENGEETIFNFTAGNSPLPSNKVNDINIDPTTGVVYFATDKGVVSYRSDAVDVGDSFGDVYSYPNPVRPGFNGNVVIKGLPNDADVKIVDVVGNLVYNTKSAGGIVEWDTKNLKGKPVASGIYLVLMTNRDASETKQTKIAIVR